MGWWSIDHEDGGIGTKVTGMFGGDIPADVLGRAFDRIIESYEHEFGRKPYEKELIAAANFALGGYDLCVKPENVVYASTGAIGLTQPQQHGLLTKGEKTNDGP
jgi:hypothetical protein